MSGETNGMRLMYFVWGWLLAATLIEVVLAYFHVPLLIMLVVLLGLSVVKSILIVSYFMHLRFEQRSLALTLIPVTLATILLLNIIFPDSVRVRTEGVFRDIPPPSPQVSHDDDAPH
ncbi:MAG: cytochrome C oxidase subunit IV family protein [Acidobacteriota bacterium]